MGILKIHQYHDKTEGKVTCRLKYFSDANEMYNLINIFYDDGTRSKDILKVMKLVHSIVSNRIQVSRIDRTGMKVSGHRRCPAPNKEP